MTTTTSTANALLEAAYELKTESPVTCLDFAGDLLAAGCEDGQVRVYALKEEPASLRNVLFTGNEELASLAWTPAGEDDQRPRDIWCAMGNRVARYEIGEPSSVPLANAVETIEPLKDEEDVISKISIDEKGSYLAYSSEDGVVGVISLGPERQKRAMRISHNSVCDCLAFLPPNHGLLSAGYDYRIIQHDFTRGTLINQVSLEQVTATQATMSLSPPFIQSLHIAANGDPACGLANGEIYVASANRPGEKEKKKDRKKRGWAALAGHGERHKAADGPIVGLYHIDENNLLACTLLGSLLHFRISPTWELLCCETVQGIAKVNCLASDGRYVGMGGVTADGKGLVVIKRFFPVGASQS